MANTEPAPAWKQYVLHSDADVIARELRTTTFQSGGETFELVYFEAGKARPNIVISPGSAGHAYLFAELAHAMHLRGFNVFIMPKQGGYPIAKLVGRHSDALAHIARSYNDRIGVFGEGLGGFAVFYLALGHGAAKSIVCMNSPAILTEPGFQEAVFHEDKPQGLKRRVLMPVLTLFGKLVPSLRVPIRLYLDFRKMVDPVEPDHTVEENLIRSYMHDAGFDRSYPLSAVLSLLTTPAPSPLSTLRTPTMFIVPKRGFAPAYTKALFARLPDIRKKLIDVDGSVFWMVSHASEAARIICDWFTETLS
jgi:hypothetical protein